VSRLKTLSDEFKKLRARLEQGGGAERIKRQHDQGKLTARERAWERAHADAVKDGAPRGWAVNGVDATLKALNRGQVRTLLADGHDDDARIDEAVEEALGQRAQVDVLYDDKARRVVDGLAALLRFRDR